MQLSVTATEGKVRPFLFPSSWLGQRQPYLSTRLWCTYWGKLNIGPKPYFMAETCLTTRHGYCRNHVPPRHRLLYIIPSNGATAQIGPWPPLLRFHNNNVLRCEVVSLTTNPR
jgi:hypothetical protein